MHSIDVVPIAAWPQRCAPGIAPQYTLPPHIVRAVRDALAAVDHDIETAGAVSATTVDKVRATRASVAYADALRAACLLPTPDQRRWACDAAHARYEIDCEALGIEPA